MDFGKIKTAIQEMLDIVNTVPDNLQEKCFEVLLSNYLTGTGAPSGSKPPDTRGNDTFENVIEYVDEEVQIVASVSGGTKRQQVINLCLLYLLGKEIKGVQEVAMTEVRDVCREHALLDGNFAKNLKAGKQLFLKRGTGTEEMIRLTNPGKNKARELAAELNTR